ncbi:MAG: hypothetical protein NUV51_09290 [Sulfuricaulis sp.]|nr:hypothetical protein [Sulfuricaulis sp.]
MTLAISSHGTIVARQPAATPGTWTDIAELGDITPPGMSRNEFDATTQEKNIDAYVLGVLRRSPLVVPLNFLYTNATHDHLTGLYKALIDNAVDGYKVTFPDGIVWIMSGQVQNIAPKAPVDGKQAADVTFRMSGYMSIGGVTVG